MKNLGVKETYLFFSCDVWKIAVSLSLTKQVCQKSNSSKDPNLMDKKTLLSVINDESKIAPELKIVE